jgi:hypothetical protein
MRTSVILALWLLPLCPAMSAAQDFCAKKTATANLVDFQSLECQFDMLFSSEMDHFGLTPNDTIRTFLTGDGVYAGEIAPYGIVSAYTTGGAYHINYLLGEDDSIRLVDLIHYAPDYFGPMQVRMERAGRPILCRLLPQEARDFMRLGGQVTFSLTLAPSIISHHTPDSFMTAVIVLDHCEAR